jgi:hypothetical protein
MCVVLCCVHTCGGVRGEEREIKGPAACCGLVVYVCDCVCCVVHVCSVIVCINTPASPPPLYRFQQIGHHPIYINIHVHIHTHTFEYIHTHLLHLRRPRLQQISHLLFLRHQFLQLRLVSFCHFLSVAGGGGGGSGRGGWCGGWLGWLHLLHRVAPPFSVGGRWWW